MAVARIGAERLPRLRAAAQLLHRPKAIRSPEEAVRLAAGIQAQDPFAARLGVRARVAGPTAADVDAARADRSILRSWAMRGTLHLVSAEDAAWLLPLFAARELSWSRRRIEELLGLDRRAQRRAVKRIARLLASEGLQSRQQVLADLERAGFEIAGQNAVYHVGRLAVLEGVACLGPEDRGKTTYVLARDWVGDPPKVERPEAMKELARRYLGAFGPADERDLAAWSGLGLRECREAVASIATELAEVSVAGERRWLLSSRRPRAPRSPLLRLVPAFDNHLMGHRAREVAVPAERTGEVWPGAGIVRATVLLDGVAIATWGARRSGSGIRITVDPFKALKAGTAVALRREAEEIGRFEGRSATLTIA